MDPPAHNCATRMPSSTMALGTAPTTVPIPDCGAALSLCVATHDRLLRSVITLAIIVGILFTISSILLFLLCIGGRRGRGGPIPFKKGTGTPGPVLERPERSEPLRTGADVINNEKVVAHSTPLGPGTASSSKVQLEIEDSVQGIRALPRVSSAASVHAFSDDDQQDSSSEQPDITIAPPSWPCLSPTPPIVAVSVDDFDQGQDDELHPGVRALVEEGKFTKEAVRALKPLPPKAGTVIPDYNPILDAVRPDSMDEYLEHYRIFFVIDDSGSMIQHWKDTRNALSEIADYALKYHSDAIDIRFFNSQYRDRGVRGVDKVMGIFRSVSPSGGTPTGRVLKEVLDEQIDRLDEAQRRGTYSSECPLDIIVLTDGVPNTNSPPAPVIEEAARRLKATKHHQNWVGIQFVQIGNDPMAGPTLLSLIDSANNNHMVDTTSYSFYKDEGGGRLTPQILERIILGGLHPNLRSYYNQFRQKVNEKTSRMIY